jgi:hypothetical protein
MKTDDKGFCVAGPRQSRVFVAFGADELEALRRFPDHIGGLEEVERLIGRMQNAYEVAEVRAWRMFGSVAGGSYAPDVPFAEFEVGESPTRVRFAALLNLKVCTPGVMRWLAGYPDVGEVFRSHGTPIRRVS